MKNLLKNKYFAVFIILSSVYELSQSYPKSISYN